MGDAVGDPDPPIRSGASSNPLSGREMGLGSGAWHVLKAPALGRRGGPQGFVAGLYGGLRKRGVEGRRAVLGMGYWVRQAGPESRPGRN